MKWWEKIFELRKSKENAFPIQDTEMQPCATKSLFCRRNFIRERTFYPIDFIKFNIKWKYLGGQTAQGLVIPNVSLSSQLIQFSCNTIWLLHWKRDALLCIF